MTDTYSSPVTPVDPLRPGAWRATPSRIPAARPHNGESLTEGLGGAVARTLELPLGELRVTSRTGASPAGPTQRGPTPRGSRQPPPEGVLTTAADGPPTDEPPTGRPGRRRRRLSSGPVLAALVLVVAVGACLPLLLDGGALTAWTASTKARTAAEQIQSRALALQPPSRQPAVAPGPPHGVASGPAPAASPPSTQSTQSVTVTLDDVRGMRYRKAARLLRARGLIVVVVVVHTAAPGGTVVGLSPSGTLPLRTRVTLTVAHT